MSKPPPTHHLVSAFTDAQEAQRRILALNEDCVTIEQIKQIQSRLSRAASHMTKLQTYMLENMPPPQDNMS